MIRCFVCGRWIIADLEAAIGYEGRVIHEKCRRRAVLRDLGWIAIVILSLCLVAQVCKAEEIYPEKEWVWGCQIKGRTLSGECAVRSFTKVGETENDVDTDEPRVIGFEPGNVPITRNGEPVWSRIPAKFFLKKGEVKLMFGAKCGCR